MSDPESFTAEQRAALENFKEGFKDAVRFGACLIGHGGHSSLWRAWNKGDDFYFGVRTLVGVLKVSLHASGI